MNDKIKPQHLSRKAILYSSALHADVARRSASAPFADLSWRDFERVVGEYFRLRGFAVVESGGGGADGGVDLVLSRGADRYLVQCKQWRTDRQDQRPSVLATHPDTS